MWCSGAALVFSVLIVFGTPSASQVTNSSATATINSTGLATANSTTERPPGPYDPISYSCFDNGFSLQTRRNHSVINRSRPGEWTTTCENSVMNLDCGTNRVLRIIDVEYGRFDTHTCHSYPGFFMRCEATDAYQKVHQRCDNKVRCTLAATSREFGDPCPGFIKYLRVKHKCEAVPPENKFVKTICDNETDIISCPPGRSVLIADALYGRVDVAICPHKNINSTNCKSVHALDILGARCDHKPNCTLSSSIIQFDDACPGTHKYLQVNYQCVLDDLQYAAACEGSDLIIECKNMSFINVVKTEYGRNHPFICNPTSKIIDPEGCSSVNELFIAFGKCQGRTRCVLPATSQVFGEPCGGKPKYLELDFFCTERLDESDSGGPPQIKSLGNDRFSFISDLLNATSSKNYMAQIKEANETIWETVIDGGDGAVDFSKPHTVGGFRPNGEYDIRIIKKEGIVSSCLPYTHVKTRGP